MRRLAGRPSRTFRWLNHEGVAYWVYILTNRSGTPYTGVTNDLERRLSEHPTGGGFAARYATNRLVYVEEYVRAADAIAREKQLKGWRRDRKLALVHAVNPSRRDLRQNRTPPEP